MSFSVETLFLISLFSTLIFQSFSLRLTESSTSEHINSLKYPTVSWSKSYSLTINIGEYFITLLENWKRKNFNVGGVAMEYTTRFHFDYISVEVIWMSFSF
jgi:hypothetical protein